MATLSVWTFPDADGARLAEGTLATLAARELITVDDAAMVTWPQDKPRPRTRQLHNLACTAAVGDAFWGLLFGMVFYVPLLVATGGTSATSELTPDTLRDVGIADSVVSLIREDVLPGTSALFVLTGTEVADRVAAELVTHEPQMIRTELTALQESALREVFAG